MLQFRIFAYADTHRYRLGVNYESLPVNRPQCPVQTYHRDGSMRFDGNAGRGEFLDLRELAGTEGRNEGQGDETTSSPKAGRKP